MNVLLRNLGSFSATIHDIDALNSLGKPANDSPSDPAHAQNDDILTEIIPPANAQNDMDLFDIDVPVSNVPGNSAPVQDNDDLFGLNIEPVTTKTQDPRIHPDPVKM